jgi:peptidoglycan-associated lipoprotein
MRNFLPRILVFIVCALLGFVACGKRPPVQPAAPPTATSAPQTPPPPPARAAAQPAVPSSEPESEEARFARMSIDELNASGLLSDVHFDYDSAALSDGERMKLQTHAGWLARWTSVVVRVEGHADERGTSEYNLALGNARAAAVREYLSALGIRNDRIYMVSKGEEDPICSEAREACWSQNRRGHFLIVAK